ncbi:hypothetical protein C8Q76DRAFT_790221 [Earliella scabrosa]|nr:hypothetical protein C8Q76DRAFT_790221 [Earliella scabrosa]
MERVKGVEVKTDEGWAFLEKVIVGLLLDAYGPPPAFLGSPRSRRFVPLQDPSTVTMSAELLCHPSRPLLARLPAPVTGLLPSLPPHVPFPSTARSLLFPHGDPPPHASPRRDEPGLLYPTRPRPAQPANSFNTTTIRPPP